MQVGNNYNQNFQNQFPNNNYQNVQSKKRNTPNLDQGYSSSGTTKKKTNYNYQNKPQNFSILSNSSPIMVNNIRNTEAPNINYKNQQFQENNQKEIPRMTEYNRGKERPAWSYREIKYDEFKQPRNTEIVTTKNIPKKTNVVEPEIPRKSNIQILQEKDKKYFNNVKYQKVKVTKKIKGGGNNIPRKGPEDDFDQKNTLQNYENNNNLLNNINSYNNNPYDDKNNFNNYNEEDNNGYNMNDEHNNNLDNNVEQIDDGLNEFLEEKIRDNNNLNKNENNENDEEFNYILNNNNNNANNMEENDNKFNNDELQNNDNYQLDLDTLEEANSVKNQQLEEENEEEEYIPQMKNNNDIDNNSEENNNEIQESNNYENNNQVKPRPTFIKTTTKKVNDKIDQIKTIPEANLEKWNLVADYTP